MVESADLFSDVPHHKKKLCLIFSAMRHLAQKLEDDGWRVEYQRISQGPLTKILDTAIKSLNLKSLELWEPGRWDIRSKIENWAKARKFPITILEDDSFYQDHTAFADWAKGRKLFRMEDFYRHMRRQTGYLMQNGNPIGGRWNFDRDNRKAAKPGTTFTAPLKFKTDRLSDEVIKDVERYFPTYFGNTKGFDFAVTSEQAQEALAHFIKRQLPNFGATQDAMLMDEPYLNHSLLSAYVNIGLLSSKQLCDAAQKAFEKGDAPIEAVEGFIRQIIGWREYIRGIYWHFMPDYVEHNFFQNTAALPDFYWTQDTNMTCMKAAFQQTRDLGYAHHIQRLMITGNFAMLYGVDPREVHKWYLAVYADAHEWVELPNTLGMSQFADGGLLATKPYAASGNYINRMSDYCKNCSYDVHSKTKANSCPFNSLYWDFIVRNKDKLKDNFRLKNSYLTWDKFSNDKKEKIQKRANRLKNSHDF